MTNHPYLNTPDQTRPHTPMSAPHAPKSDQIRPNLNKPDQDSAQSSVPNSKITIPAQKFALSPPPPSIEPARHFANLGKTSELAEGLES